MPKPLSSAKTINFLPQGSYITEHELEKRKTILSGSIIALFLYLILVLSITVFLIFLTSQKKQLDQSIASLTNQIKAHQQQETQHLAISDRLDKIALVLTPVLQSFDPPQLILQAKAALPPEVEIKTIIFEKDTVSLDITLPQLDLLSQIESSTHTLAKKLGFTQVKLSRLARSADAPYQATLDFTRKI